MSLNYKQAGEGEALLLIHGLFGSLENLGTLARSLSSHFCVYSLDLPNHGRSPHTASTSLPLLAEGVEKFMDELGLEKVNILGHSLGGKTAMEMAMRKPERIHKLVVLDIAPVQYSAHHDEVFAALHAIKPQALKTRQDAEAVFKQFLTEPALISFLMKNLQRDQQGHFSWRINLPVLYRDYDKILMGNSQGNFFGPVMFIKGEHSNYVQEAHRPEIQKRFSNVQLKVVAGTAHWLHAEKPTLVSNIALRFLNS